MMMEENIEDIVWRDIRNECSEEEKIHLQEWREASEENRHTYEEIRSIIQCGALIQGYDRLDKSRALDKVMKRVKPSPVIRRFSWIKYAAAIVLPLLVGVVAYYLFDLTAEGSHAPVIAKYDIQPGEAKAVLYLSDGREINLKDVSDSTIRDGYSDQEILFRDKSNTLNYYDSLREENTVGKLVYNKIVVPRGGEYMLILSDGTKVWLNSETEMEYPLCFGQNIREVRLKGEAYFEVKKDIERPFNVLMGDARIEVTGTSFNASCYPENGDCSATLASGKINLWGNHSMKRINVGERAVYDKTSKEITVKTVDLKYYTSWRHGTFYFYDTPLSEITEALGRWYDVKFYFTDEALRDVCFSGAALRNRPIDFILKLLESTQSLKFSIKKDGTIWINKK